MNKHLSKRKQQGQAIVIIAAALVGLLALVALAVDGGNAFAQRRNAQNAADGAAMAAIAKMDQFFLANRTSKNGQPIVSPMTAAQNYEVLQVISATLHANNASNAYAPNGDMEAWYINPDGQRYGNNMIGLGQTVPFAGGSGPGSDGAAGIWVQSTSSQPTYFARILGINNVTADAHAGAQMGSFSAYSPANLVPDTSGGHDTPILWPLTILTTQTYFSPGSTITLHSNDPATQNWGDLNYINSTPLSMSNCSATFLNGFGCWLNQGFGPADSRSAPFVGFADNGPSPGRPPSTWTQIPNTNPISIPLGSDGGFTPQAKGVWIAGTPGNRSLPAPGDPMYRTRSRLQNAYTYRWHLLMPISDASDANGSTPPSHFHVVDLVAVQVMAYHCCSNSDDMTLQVLNYAWNESHATFSSNLYRAAANGQLVNRLGP